VKLEQIAAPPPQLSPEMRYASLHRTVENGLATDRTWTELIQVCVELRKHDEALEAFDRLASATHRTRAHGLLRRHGLVTAGPDEEDQKRLRVTEVDLNPGIREQVLDAFRFLFEDHMPLTVVVATLTFPLVVGLGGVLTSGSQFFLLPLIALIPAVSVLGLVGALGRRILLEASQGLDDAPTLPSVPELAREAAHFLLDGLALCTIFLGPGLALTLLDGTGSSAAIVALCVGGLILPMAMAIRQTTGRWRTLAPTRLFPAVIRCSPRYLAIAAVTVLLFAPAALSFYLTMGSQLYLVVSVIGPLSVAPLFVASRLMGQVLHNERDTLRELFDVPENRCATRIAAESPPAPTPARAPTTTARQRGPLGAPSHPEAGTAKQRPAPQRAQPPARQPASPAPAPPAAREAAAPPSPAPTPRARQAQAPAGAPPLRRPTPSLAAPAPGLRGPVADPQHGGADPGYGAPPARPSRWSARATTQPASSQAAPAPAASKSARQRKNGVVGDAIPDLTKLPGVSVVRGEQREKAGASSTSRGKQ
jgi:hypothetical protein